MAIQVGVDCHPSFADGAVFVDLAPLSDPTLVAARIAQALGVRERVEQPIVATLERAVEDKHLLLVLDNFEHVLPAAPVVAALLQAAPQLQVVITSRVVVGVYGEQLIEVSPLHFPDASPLPPLAQLGEYDAIRLFVAHARTLHSAFVLADDNAPDVAAICQRLDGLPLAIELAAARIRFFPPAVLLSRLEQRLPFLTGGARTLPARQQTLRATLDWSHTLLHETEQALFRRLGVFAGGWDLVAAAAVCSHDVVSTGQIAIVLEALVAHSLVKVMDGQGGEPRFTMLETLREYAREQLAASEELETMQRRHAAYFLALVEPDARNVEPPPPPAWFKNVEEEYDNLRAALAWSVDHNEQELALRLSVALGYFWLEKGYWTEGRGWLEAALCQTQLDLTADKPDALLAAFRAQALRWDAWLAFTQGDLEAARMFGQQALNAFRALEDPLLLAHALVVLSSITFDHRDMAPAWSLNEEALTLYRALDERRGIATVLNNMGWQAHLVGDDRAKLLIEQSLREGRASGLDCIYALNSLAFVLLERGDYMRARDLLVTGMGEARTPRNKEILVPYLEGFACLATLEGTLRGEGAAGARRAARCFGAAEAQREEIGAMLLAPEAALRARHIAVARAYLDQEAWETAWREGRAMIVEQAVAYALDASDTVITR